MLSFCETSQTLEEFREQVVAGDAGLKRVKVLRVGTFHRQTETGDIRKIDITPDALAKMVENYDTDLRRKIERPVDVNHSMKFAEFRQDSFEAGKSSGWVKELDTDGEFLYAMTEFTSKASDAISEGEYRYVSAAFEFDAWDSHSGENVGPKFFGFTMTNQPFLQDLGPIEFSDKRIQVFGEEADPIKNFTGDDDMSDKLVELSSDLAARKVELSNAIEKIEQMTEAAAARDQELSDAKAQIGDLEGKVEAGDAKVAELEKKNKKLEEFSEKLVGEQEELRAEQNKLEIERKVSEGYVLPSEKDSMIELRAKDQDWFENFVEKRGKVVDTKEIGSDNSADEEGNDGVVEFAMKLAKEKGIKLVDAIRMAKEQNSDRFGHFS